MADLRERLSAHITSTAYIKGWEVDKRKCVGAKRASLRRAARQAKTFSTGSWNTQRQRAVEKLMTELAAAGEADFDGMLSEALEMLSSLADREPDGAGGGGLTAAVSSLFAAVAPPPPQMPSDGLAASVTSLFAAAAAAPPPVKMEKHLAREKHLTRVKKQGKRDYGKAEELAAQTRAAASEYAAALEQARKAQAAYSARVEALRQELEIIGEDDFDGLLRQAMTTLKGSAIVASDRTSKGSADLTEVPETPSTPSLAADSRTGDGHPASAAKGGVTPPATPPPTRSLMPDAIAMTPSPTPPPQLEVAEVDAGCVRLGTLPARLQEALLREAFPKGAVGVCGGLIEGQRVRGAHGGYFEPAGVATVGWSDLGLHGNHLVSLETTRGAAAEAVLDAIRAAAPQLPAETRSRLEAFEMTSVRLSFERMGGRTIRGKSGSLCGWSSDKLRAGGSDGGLKVIILLGSAEVCESFKYSKKDKEALDVPLKPGEILLLHDDGRAWLSAVTSISACDAEQRDAGPGQGRSPFDFAHLSLLDLREYRRAKPLDLVKLLVPERPEPRDGSYKWMQCTYSVLKAADMGEDSPVVELRGSCAMSEI
jgi:hypothetical protein